MGVYFCTFGTYCFPTYMIIWRLPKFAMFWTYNTDLCMSIFIFNFGIIIFIPIYLYCPFYPYLCCVTISIFITLRASITTKMTIWFLPKLAMYWTNYTNFGFIIDIFNFRIIIFISVNLFSLFNEFLFCVLTYPLAF